MERLFVYGTLAPGRANHHRLQQVAGSWQAASLRGELRDEGWGASLGCPGIVPDEAGETVAGHLLSADSLQHLWPMLDAFEGEGYQRTLVDVTLADGSTARAYVYALRLDD